MKYITLLLLSVFLTCQATPTNTSELSGGYRPPETVYYHQDESTNLCFAIAYQGYHGIAMVLVPCDSIKNKLQ